MNEIKAITITVSQNIAPLILFSMKSVRLKKRSIERTTAIIFAALLFCAIKRKIRRYKLPPPTNLKSLKR